MCCHTCTFCLEHVSSKPIQLRLVKHGRVSGPTGGPFTPEQTVALSPLVSLPWGYILLWLLLLDTCCADVCHCFSLWFLAPPPALLEWYGMRAMRVGSSPVFDSTQTTYGWDQIDRWLSRTFRRQTLIVGSLPLCQEGIALPPPMALVHLPKTTSVLRVKEQFFVTRVHRNGTCCG